MATDRDQGLFEAVVSVAAGLELTTTLRRIVQAAVNLSDATYGALGVLAVCFVWLGVIGSGPGTDVHETYIGRVLTFLYFAFFITMPIWTRLDKTKPVPERVTTHD